MLYLLRLLLEVEVSNYGKTKNTIYTNDDALFKHQRKESRYTYFI